MTNELRTHGRGTEHFAAQLWADVGGTFTDCFCIVDGLRRSIKVLSSGVVRGRLVLVQDNRVQISHSLKTAADFWNGATIRIMRDGTSLLTSKVIQQVSSDLLILEHGQSRERHDSIENGLLIELDPGLEAPVLAAHLLLGIPLSQSLPPIDIRLGTTRGTNALLTRGGATVGLVTTLGFGDCLEIGEQNRPDLFALTIQKPEPLTRRVIEVDERLTASGEVLRVLDPETLRKPLTRWLQSGVNSLAICLLHAHVNDIDEKLVVDVAREVGFTNISVSSHVAPMIKLVSRAETTVLDAYLTPILADYVTRLDAQFNRFRNEANKSRLRLMTSAGNLVDAASFRGGDSILSGPAGGAVALGKIADAFAPQGAIGLDMGGTSTDVCRYSGRIPRDYESRKAGVRVLAPMIAIHTVAAGGGSICDVDDGRLIVGPKSAGAAPGPACYGRGGPLTVTDLNVILGRLPLDRFPFPLDIDAARKRLREVNAKLGVNRFDRDEQAAEGFLTIAVTHMAEAVRTTSTAQGSDPRDFTLVGFGGAAGGHLCAIADAIGMTRIIDHRDASLLSALGMGLADVGRIRSRGIYRMFDEIEAAQWQTWSDAVRADAIESLSNEGEIIVTGDVAKSRLEADVRYQGTEATLTLVAHPLATLSDRFHQAHLAEFGFDQPNRRIEIATIRCEATFPSTATLDPLDQPISLLVEQASPLFSEQLGQLLYSKPTGEMRFQAQRSTSVCIEGTALEVLLFNRDQVEPGSSITGPAIVVDDNSTLVIDSGWIATKQATASFELNRVAGTGDGVRRSRDQVDAVTVEVVARRMQGIADSMGETLRRTAASVNIRQRLDYSCAIFTAEGELIANAPHVPVHLGAMGHTVRETRKAFPVMSTGDVYVSNNPYAGGSHLPDVTVVTPVFCNLEHDGNSKPESKQEPARPQFYVASRAHHAEIGGKTPGSMPPDATSLSEEGVVIDTFALRRDGVEALDQLRTLLTSGQFPSRDPETNLADIAAQRAAGILGCNYLLQLVESMGMPQVDACVATLFNLADDLVRRWIASLDAAPMLFRDSLEAA